MTELVGNQYSKMLHHRLNQLTLSHSLNYLLPEQRDFVTRLRRANKYEPFRTIELKDSETPVSRI